LEQLLAEIKNCFSGLSGTEYKIYMSRYPRDAIAAVHRYITSCPKDEVVRIYAVGGDGIHFECLNGMVDFPNAELTNVPYGNANDFIRAFGEDAAEKFRDIKSLITAPSRPVDIIHCGSNYAINEANIGIVGQTIIHANKVFPLLPAKLLRKNASLAYSLCAAMAIFNKEIIRQQYTVRLDGEDFSGNYCNIQISNAPCQGGTFMANPHAKPGDGFLEVILARFSSKLKFLKAIGDYNKGRFQKYDYFVHKRCRSLQIESNDLMRVEIDGEGFYARNIKMDLIPGGIKFFAPEGMGFVDYSYKAYKAPVNEGAKDGRENEKT
jgi:diacylglycerol kinase family enzyme